MERTLKVTFINTYTIAEGEETEVVGGDNVTPRDMEEKTYYNESGFPYDPSPYMKKGYQGTDEYVKAKMQNRSQGIPGVKKANSMIRLRRDMPAEEVIGAFNKSRKNFMIRSGRDADMGRHVFMKDSGQHNLYDPNMEEPPLAPQRD